MVVGEFNGRSLYTGLIIDLGCGLLRPHRTLSTDERLPMTGWKLCDVSRLGLSSYCRVGYRTMP